MHRVPLHIFSIFISLEAFVRRFSQSLKFFLCIFTSQTKRSLDTADSTNPTKRGRQEIVAYDDKSKALVASDGTIKRHSSLHAPIMKLEGHQVRFRYKFGDFMFSLACTVLVHALSWTAVY